VVLKNFSEKISKPNKKEKTLRKDPMILLIKPPSKKLAKESVENKQIAKNKRTRGEVMQEHLGKASNVIASSHVVVRKGTSCLEGLRIIVI